jgi:hypothetical protein
MPKTLYITNTPAADPTPYLPEGDAYFDDVDQRRTVLLGETPSGANVEISATENNSSTNWDVCLVDAYSAPIEQSVTLQGAYDLSRARRESNTAANLTTLVIIWVLTPANAVRGILTNAWLSTPEWPTTATAHITGGTVDPVSVEPGDRLVVGVGYEATNSTGSSTTYTGYIRIGGTDTTALVHNSTTGITSRSPRIVFYDDSFTTAFTTPPMPPGRMLIGY